MALKNKLLKAPEKEESHNIQCSILYLLYTSQYDIYVVPQN